MPVRIYDIAKKLGIESKVVLAKAKELGISTARVPSSSLDKITAEFLEGHFTPKAAPVAPPPPPTAEPITIVSAPPPPTEAPVVTDEVAAPVEAEPPTEAPPEPAPAAEAPQMETPLVEAKAPV